MGKRPTTEQLIELWNLEPMSTENVLFSQTYVARENAPNGKPFCTAIVALLTDSPGSFSDMHRLPTDEIWHFYLGDPIELLLLYPTGYDEVIILGQDVLEGQRIQVVVPKNVWMGARLRPGGRMGVFGNTMAPGYTLSDFEGGMADKLIEQWPHRGDLIRAMTRQGAPTSYA